MSVLHSSNIDIMSLLRYIPAIIDEEDFALAKSILDFEFSFIILLVIFTQHALEEEDKNRKRKRSVWVRPHLKRRRLQGHYDNLMQELAAEDPILYRNFIRLKKDLFNEIVERVRPYLERKESNFREPLDVGIQVAITLRFLATGDTYISIGYAFRVAPNTISKVIPATCRAIVASYGDEVIQLPATPEEWKKVAQGFEDRWHVPHAIGAIDGKHVRIRKPKLSGSHYFNYKRY